MKSILFLIIVLIFSNYPLYPINDKSIQEDFIKFFYEFNENKDFQLSRIIFPFINSYTSSINDKIEYDTIQNNKNWKYIFLLDTCNGYFNFLYDKQPFQSDTLIYVSFIPNSGGAMDKWYFISKNGLWYLSKHENDSD
jgi:hypothetical protein